MRPKEILEMWDSMTQEEKDEIWEELKRKYSDPIKNVKQCPVDFAGYDADLDECPYCKARKEPVYGVVHYDPEQAAKWKFLPMQARIDILRQREMRYRNENVKCPYCECKEYWSDGSIIESILVSNPINVGSGICIDCYSRFYIYSQDGYQSYVKKYE